MRTRFKLVASMLLISLCSDAFAQSKAESSLKKERSNLERTSDPVARAKVGIKISELLITLITDAARAGNDKVIEGYLDEYSKTISDAHQTLMKTGKDAHKHPDGFKDLEIALRKQQGKLTDAGRLMDFEQRGDIDKVRKLASDISDQLVKTMLLKEPNAAKR